MLIEKTNIFYYACMPGKNKNISKIRLLEKIARQKASTIHEDTFVFYNDRLMIMLNDEIRVMIVRYDKNLVCDTCPISNGGMIFHDGDWFAEVEKYRQEIEENLKQIEAVRIERLVFDSFKMPSYAV